MAQLVEGVTLSLLPKLPQLQMVALLPASTPLPRPPNGFSLISLNVLLPNSIDGWWLYKYYPPGVPDSAMAWPARAALLESLLLRADPDIVCLQECAAESFEADFSFLHRAGYNAALYGKGRMRPATLWKASRFALCDAAGALAPADPELVRPAGAQDGAPLEYTTLPGTTPGVTQGDRTLLTALRLLGDDGAPAAAAPPLWVVNVHLSAGAEARRRLSQVHDGLDRIRKQRAKALPKDHPPRAAVVVAGDFNSQGATAVRELLTRGEVLPDYREAGDPTEREQASTEVTSKPKRQVVGAFVDACDGGALCGPTYYAPTLQPLMVDDATGAISDGLRAALADCFAKLSADGKVLTMEEQRKWLVAVNKKEGAAASGGRRRRRARRRRQRARTRRVRRRVCRGGGAGQILGRRARPARAPRRRAGGRRRGAVHRRLRLRRVGLARGGCVQPPLDEARAAMLANGETWLPNEWYASDHLPVGAALRFREGPA